MAIAADSYLFPAGPTGTFRDPSAGQLGSVNDALEQVTEHAIAAILAVTTEDVAGVAALLSTRRHEPSWHRAVRAAMARASSTVSQQAERLLSSHQWLAAARQVKQAPQVWITDDGALKLEWLRADRSLGIFFEEDERDSGWAFATSASTTVRPEWGTLPNLQPARLFRLLNE